MKQRLVALDWMRGLVMVLMAVDHASGAFNSGRLITDSPVMYEAGMALPAAQFWTRWVTHLCAPTFLFLAGTALALSVERRLRAGDSGRAVDRHLLVRGLVIAALDPLLISGLWRTDTVFLQVLYAIGVSLVLMVPLRRLPTRWLVGTAVTVLVLSEMATGLLFYLAGDNLTLLGSLLLHAGLALGIEVAYPVLPWLAMMALGWAFGRRLAAARAAEEVGWSPAKGLAVGGLCMLGLFVLVRGANSYGNMILLRDDNSLIQWMHVSKYPPSLSFAALELGLMCVVLALLVVIQNRFGDRVRQGNPLLVFGQTALFFYVLHIVLLEVAARVLGVHHELGLGAAYVAAVAVLVVLYPACRWYRAYKSAHPGGWTRYI